LRGDLRLRDFDLLFLRELELAPRLVVLRLAAHVLAVHVPPDDAHDTQHRDQRQQDEHDGEALLRGHGRQTPDALAYFAVSIFVSRCLMSRNSAPSAGVPGAVLSARCSSPSRCMRSPFAVACSRRFSLRESNTRSFLSSTPTFVFCRRFGSGDGAGAGG